MLLEIETKILRFCSRTECLSLTRDEVFYLRLLFKKRGYQVDPSNKIRKHMKENVFRDYNHDLGRLIVYSLGWEKSQAIMRYLLDIYENPHSRMKNDLECEIIGFSPAHDELLFAGLVTKMILGLEGREECLAVLN